MRSGPWRGPRSDRLGETAAWPERRAQQSTQLDLDPNTGMGLKAGAGGRFNPQPIAGVAMAKMMSGNQHGACGRTGVGVAPRWTARPIQTGTSPWRGPRTHPQPSSSARQAVPGGWRCRVECRVDTGASKDTDHPASGLRSHQNVGGSCHPSSDVWPGPGCMTANTSDVLPSVSRWAPRVKMSLCHVKGCHSG